jgi:protein TonB
MYTSLIKFFVSTLILLTTSIVSFGQSEKVVVETAEGTIITTQEVDGEIFTIVDEPAKFPGGMPALREYLSRNIKYPQSAVDKNREGKCYIEFVVSEDGTITRIKVKKGVRKCRECNAEAVRVIKEMPKWEPGKVNGKPVNSTFSLPISFKL